MVSAFGMELPFHFETSLMMTLMLVLFGCAIIGMIIALVIDEKKHKFDICAKEVLKNGFIVHITKAKIWKDKDGIEFLRLRKKINGKRVFAQMPDKEFLTQQENGRKYLTLYILPTMETSWQKDDSKNKKAEIKAGKGQIAVQDDKNYEFVQSVSPYTTNQRSMLVSQHKKMIQDAGAGGWKQHLALIIGIVGIIIMLVIGLLIYDSWSENQAKWYEAQKEIVGKQYEMAKVYEKMDQNIQEIKNSLTEEKTRLNNTITR